MAILKQTASILVLAAAFSLGLAGAPAMADDYPSRPIKIIAPFGAAGPTDVYARAIAEELRKSLHQTVIIENRPVAGTTIGTDLVAKAAPDGCTLLMISGTQCVNETLYSKKPYQLMRDLVPVAPLVDTDLVLVATPSLPVKNVAELLALARASAAPSITARRVQAPIIIWPANCSKT
jgi:tripartite-type tricarboxylate transporter receptor subunit TctC